MGAGQHLTGNMSLLAGGDWGFLAGEGSGWRWLVEKDIDGLARGLFLPGGNFSGRRLNCKPYRKKYIPETLVLRLPVPRRGHLGYPIAMRSPTKTETKGVRQNDRKYLLVRQRNSVEFRSRFSLVHHGSALLLASVRIRMLSVLRPSNDKSLGP